MHNYNKCKDLAHLFIICGAVHVSWISRNPWKALSIHVNHKTFQESKTLFFLICKRRPLLVIAYDIYLYLKQESRSVYIYTHYLFNTKETVQYTDSKEIKTMFHSILCRFLSAVLKIYWQISMCWQLKTTQLPNETNLVWKKLSQFATIPND